MIIKSLVIVIPNQVEKLHEYFWNIKNYILDNIL